jgi:hypothetical protein
MHVGGEGAGNEVPGSLTAQASVAQRPLGHPSAIESAREIGKLMDHDIRPRRRNSA